MMYPHHNHFVSIMWMPQLYYVINMSSKHPIHVDPNQQTWFLCGKRLTSQMITFTPIQSIAPKSLFLFLCLLSLIVNPCVKEGHYTYPSSYFHIYSHIHVDLPNSIVFFNNIRLNIVWETIGISI